jgi:phenylpropionate dioxygenase-like ring-hydroxylating dioxygenase large terminal subunit
MLSKAQNDLVTQTGPGTPGGRLLRSYWQPLVTSEEFPIGSAPMPVKIMSEELVLFRDDKDRLGLIGLHCPHRGTDLSYGRVENGGLRCLYHGWLFDIEGKCIDQPAEPEDKKFCHKVRQVSYPVQEMGGCIWTYMGEGEAPLIPDFQFLTAPEPNRWVARSVSRCNWLQSLEGSTDPAHTTYLHRLAPGTRSVRSAGNDARMLRGIEPPKINIEHVSYGTRIYALHNSPMGGKYLRVNNYAYPCVAIPTTSTGDAGYQGRWNVPIDDYNNSHFEFFYRHAEPLDKDALRKLRSENVGPDNRHVRRLENRYLQDRESMKGDGVFSGMGNYFPAHDCFAAETQGPIQDRTQEHLGSTDIVIIEIRKALLKAIKQMEETGEAPWRIKDTTENPFGDFVCVSTFVGENEDGASFCRRYLATKAAAE